MTEKTTMTMRGEKKGGKGFIFFEPKSEGIRVRVSPNTGDNDDEIANRVYISPPSRISLAASLFVPNAWLNMN